MVRWFLSAHQSATELIHSLHTQVESYKTHTNALKAELNAACRRQLTSMAASLDYQVCCIHDYNVVVMTTIVYRKMSRHLITGECFPSNHKFMAVIAYSGNIATQGALLGVSMAKSLHLISEQHE